MVYSVTVLAHRKQGVSQATFKTRYERHMNMVAGLVGEAMPLSHLRLYPRHDSTTDKSVFLAGDANAKDYAVIVLMEFEDEAHFNRFHKALLTEEANAKVMEDEAGFWERGGMQVMVVDTCRTWKGL